MDWKKLMAELAGMDLEALAEARAKAVEAFKPYNEGDPKDFTDEQLDEMDAISAYLVEADNVGTSLEQANEERSQRIEAARATVTKAGEKPGEEEPKAEAKETSKEESKEEPNPLGEVVTREAAEEKEPSLVAAVARRTSVARAAAGNSKTPIKDEEKAPSFSLTAAAGIRGYENGQALDGLSSAGPAIMDRLQALPTIGDGVRVVNQALTIRLPENPFNSGAYQGRYSEMLMEAGRENTLQGNSLVAAGGWGAPSEQLLDFCPLETTDGLLQLPEVTVTRPGITYTRGPDFENVMNSTTGFWDMTEATAEAGTELKTSLRPAVPDFQEARLDAVGVMMECGLLLRAGWPEVVERYAQMALIAHQMKVSAKVLAKVREFTGPAIDLDGVGLGNALDILHILELVGMGERQRFAMGESQTLEVLLPIWAKAVIRVDLANRTGVTDWLSVTDQQINAFFTARKMRVQWLNLYQQIDVNTSGVAVSYPSEVEAIMYPAGTYVKGVKPVITLDTVYDSVNLKKNDYVHLFVESGVMVTNPCNTGRRVKFPLVANGRTGAADIIENFGGLAPVTP